MNGYAALAQSIRLTCRGMQCRVTVEIGKGFALESDDPGQDIEALVSGLPVSLYALAAAVYQYTPKDYKDPETGARRNYPFPPARNLRALLHLAEVLDLWPTVTAPTDQDHEPDPFNPFD